MTALEGIGLQDRRALIQVLAVEHGHAIRSSIERGRDVDLVIEVEVLGRSEPVLVRLAGEVVSSQDLADCAEAAEFSSCNTFLIVGDPQNDVVDPVDLHRFIRPREVVDLLEESSLIAWRERVPAAETDVYAEFRQTHTEMRDADPVGLRWLRPLAHNKLPPELKGSDRDAETWFEQIIFRLGTRVLGLHGRQLGTRRRGEAEPDGFFVDEPQGRAWLYDCKASRDGWEMTAAEQRKLVEYCQADWFWRGERLNVVGLLVFSSSFTASAASFSRRRANFRAKGFGLTYVSAAAMTRLCLPLASDPDGWEAAAVLDWDAVFAAGQTDNSPMTQLVDGALARARDLRAADEALQSATGSGGLGGNQ